MIRALLVSKAHYYNQSLSQVLSQKGSGIKVVDTSYTCQDLQTRIGITKPSIVLIDVGVTHGFEAMSAVSHLREAPKVIGLSVSENHRDVLHCAQAGACGCVPTDASIDDLSEIVNGVAKGEVVLSTQQTMQLFMDLSLPAPKHNSNVLVTLTPREVQVARCITKGQSNNEIAVTLHVETSTVKNHIHAILEKTGLHRRGEIAASLREHYSHP